MSRLLSNPLVGQEVWPNKQVTVTPQKIANIVLLLILLIITLARWKMHRNSSEKNTSLNYFYHLILFLYDFRQNILEKSNFCQAQPKPQFSWAELSYISNFNPHPPTTRESLQTTYSYSKCPSPSSAGLWLAVYPISS